MFIPVYGLGGSFQVIAKSGKTQTENLQSKAQKRRQLSSATALDTCGGAPESVAKF